MDPIKIGDYIATLRKAQKWTQSELADKLNISDKTVSKWESGNGLPDISVLPALAKIFGITVDELLAGKGKKSSLNESIYGKIASGDLDFLEEIEKGLKYDGLDEYGKSLADYCAEKNNIEVFRLLVKLNKILIANKTETRSNINIRPGGKETLIYEDVILYDYAHSVGKFNNSYPKDYNDSALVCLLLKNREDEMLQKLNLHKRAFTANEADCIAEDFDYYYKKYFLRNFPSHIGVLILALLKKNKRNDALKCLNLITDHKKAMEEKRAERETIIWNTGVLREPVYDKELKQSVIMHDKIAACVVGSRQIYIIGDAIIFTQDELAEIGFADNDFLVECRKLGYEPNIDDKLMMRLLEKDDVKLFKAFTAGETLSVELEKLILNSNGKIKAKYTTTNVPQNINNVIGSNNVDLVLDMISKPKDALRYSKEVAIESLGGKDMFPILNKLIPFFDKRQLDFLLGEIVKEDNPKARVALIEAGAMLYSYNEYGEKSADKIQTEILYKLSKMEIK